MAKSHRSNAPSNTESRGKVNAHARDYAGFGDIGGYTGGSGWEGGKAKPERGTGGGADSNAHGSSKQSEESEEGE